MTKKSFSRKLSLNHESLRTLSGEDLMEVNGGRDSTLINCSAQCTAETCVSCAIYCGPLR